MSTETKTKMAWHWCCQQPQFTSKQLQQAAGMSKHYSNQMIARWVRLGVIERIPDTALPTFYRVIDPQHPPRLGSGSNPTKGCKSIRRRNWRKTQRQKMWNSMQINKSFSLIDLMLTCDALRAKAFVYVERLVLAGYVKVLHRIQRQSIPMNEREPTRYQLVRDTGRLAPIIRPNGCWDQNEQRLYPFLIEESEHGHVA